MVAMKTHAPAQLDCCGTPRPLGEVVDDLVDDLHFHRQVEKLHRLGPRAVGELLVEIGEQRLCRMFIDQRLEAYGQFDPELIRKLGGKEFPRPPLHQVRP